MGMWMCVCARHPGLGTEIPVLPWWTSMVTVYYLCTWTSIIRLLKYGTERNFVYLGRSHSIRLTHGLEEVAPENAEELGIIPESTAEKSISLGHSAIRGWETG
jgi:hypothetical protein